MIDLSSINSNLLKSFIDNDFSGHDPFDSLNSKIFNLTPLKYSKIAKLIFTQLGKRSPINLRNLLLVPKSRNAKGVALIILGLIENFKISNDDYYLDQAKTLVDWLILNKCEKKIWSHNCWGYNFEWQARAFNVPKGSPNIVTTYFVSLAILKFSEIINNTELQNQALDSSFFMTKYLLNHNENEMTFNYVPNSKTFVHNANLFGAHWCLVAGKIMKNDKMTLISKKATKYTIKSQKKDGSWVYGNKKHHKWIDGFHTGYNLELLNKINKVLNDDEINSSIKSGYDYYMKNFILDDGTVKYYNNSLYPLDSHSYSQAILTILEIDKSNKVILEKIVNSFISRMYLFNKKRFIYQKTKYFKNSINYIRWTQAWAYFSINKYINFINETN
tara:strand:- start:1254 stop:2417 length:1164 start_codon:yes stop_codon:yes gene_type:complete